MIKAVTPSEELGIAIPALVAIKSLENKGKASIVDISQISPELAETMRKLGYTDLTPELLRAFYRTGQISLPGNNNINFFQGPAVKALAGT